MKTTNSNYLKLIKFIGFVVFVLLSNSSNAQLDYNWAFGFKTGLNFSNIDSIKWIRTGMYSYFNKTYTISNHATQNDCNGEIMFYTNGQIIFNKNGQVINNSWLDTANKWKFRSAGPWNTGVLILKKPKHKFTFIIVYSSLFEEHTSYKNFVFQNSNGFKFAEIEFNPIDSSWKVNYKDRPFGPKIIGSSNLTYIKHSDNERIWVLFPKNKDTLLSYLLDSTGFNYKPISSPVKTVVSILNNNGKIENKISGLIKPSHSGNNLFTLGCDFKAGKEFSNSKFNQVFCYDFDRKNGIVSKEKKLFKTQFPPGKKWEKSLLNNAELSSNDSFIFLAFNFSAFNTDTTELSIWRYNLNNHSFSRLKEINLNKFSNLGSNLAIQLGPDEKIYIFGVNVVYRLNTPNEANYKAELFAEKNTIGYYYNPYLRVVQNAYTLSNRVFLPDKPALQENCVDSSVFYFSGDTLAYKLVWKFGDGDSLVQKTPIPWYAPIKHKYPYSGTYPVELHAYFTECNFHKVVYDTLFVKLKPVLKHYSLTQSPSCFNDTFHWNLSIDHADSAYLWNGDSVLFRVDFSKVNSQFIDWICSDSGVQHIRWEIFNQYGCRLEVFDTLYPQLLPHPENQWIVNRTPIDSFVHSPISGCSALKLNFENLKDTISRTQVWALNLDTLSWPGNEYSLILQDSILKNYTLQLKYYNSSGCYTVDSLKARVFPPLILDIDFFAPSNCLKNNQLRLENKSYSPTDSVKIFWGDGSSISWTSNKINHVFTEAGSYPLAIFANSEYGCSDTLYQSISIHEQAKPDFKFMASSYCLNNNELLFEPKNSSYLFSAHWGDGTSDYNLYSEHTHHYNTSGTFDVQLIIQTPFDCIDTFYHQIHILPPSKNRWTTVTDNPCIGDTISFINDSEFPSQQEKQGSVFYLLSNNQLIDSFSSSFETYKTSFSKSGDWNYLFVLKSPNNCLDSFIASGYTHEPTPINFVAEDICPENPLIIKSTWQGTLQFMTLDIPSISFFEQIADPGKIWVSKAHFLNTGVHPIFLNTENEFGCKKYDTLSIRVHPSPVAKFGYEELEFDPYGSQLQLIDSSIDAMAWHWNINNQEYHQIQNPQTLIPANENIWIQLQVESEFDCLDSTQKSIHIEHPIQFSFPTAISCNKDGRNEYFMTSESAWMKEIDVKIYNRWGELVFKSNDLNFKWNSPDQEVYTYLIKIKDINNKKHYHKGTFHVIK